MSKNSRLVYSTDVGKIKSEPESTLKKDLDPNAVVKLERESKGRGGKPVTLIKNVPLHEAELKVLAKELKKLCGTGGTIKDGIIEIQGEQREKLKVALEKKGFKVKIAGG